MNVTVVSFYTPTWDYPAHARRLAAECDILGLPRRIVQRPDAGSYLANTRQKPAVILEALRELGTPVLWLDADGSILRRPDALRGDVDFMGRRMPLHRRRIWHVGTMFFNATTPALGLLEDWARLTLRGTDEASFDVAWRRWSGIHRSAELPPEYFEVLQPRKQPSDACVICHRLSRSESKMAAKRRAATR